MAQVSAPRTSSSPQNIQGGQNIQDAFLNYVRRERMSVSIYLMDGRQFDARIKNFDRFAVIVDVNGADHLVFKHAISTIATQRSVANYLSQPHS